MTATVLRLITFRASTALAQHVVAAYRSLEGDGMLDLALGSRSIAEGTEHVLASTWEAADRMELAIAGIRAELPVVTHLVETFDVELRHRLASPPPTLVRIYRGMLDGAAVERIQRDAARDLRMLAGIPSCSLMVVGSRPSGEVMAVSLWSDPSGPRDFEHLKVTDRWRWSWLGAPTEALHYDAVTARIGVGQDVGRSESPG